jgi:hypothetical protein
MSNIKLFESKQIRATWDEMLKSNWGTICPLVEMKAADGKKGRNSMIDRTLPQITQIFTELTQIKILWPSVKTSVISV